MQKKRKKESVQREQVKKVVCRERRDEAVRSYSLIEYKPESEKERRGKKGGKKRVGWGLGGVRFCHTQFCPIS